MTEKWIQKAIKKPGELRKYLHIKKGEKIPEKKLENNDVYLLEEIKKLDFNNLEDIRKLLLVFYDFIYWIREDSLECNERLIKISSHLGIDIII